MLVLNAQNVAFGAWRVDVTVDRSVALPWFSVSLTNETSGTTCISATTLTPSFSATCSTGVTLSFVDGAGPGQLTTGDYFELTGVFGANGYALRILRNATDAVIATVLIGSGPSFTE